MRDERVGLSNTPIGPCVGDPARPRMPILGKEGSKQDSMVRYISQTGWCDHGLIDTTPLASIASPNSKPPLPPQLTPHHPMQNDWVLLKTIHAKTDIFRRPCYCYWFARQIKYPQKDAAKSIIKVHKKGGQTPLRPLLVANNEVCWWFFFRVLGEVCGQCVTLGYGMVLKPNIPSHPVWCELTVTVSHKANICPTGN